MANRKGAENRLWDLGFVFDIGVLARRYATGRLLEEAGKALVKSAGKRNLDQQKARKVLTTLVNAGFTLEAQRRSHIIDATKSAHPVVGRELMLIGRSLMDTARRNSRKLLALAKRAQTGVSLEFQDTADEGVLQALSFRVSYALTALEQAYKLDVPGQAKQVSYHMQQASLLGTQIAIRVATIQKKWEAAELLLPDLPEESQKPAAKELAQALAMEAEKITQYAGETIHALPLLERALRLDFDNGLAHRLYDDMITTQRTTPELTYM